MDQIQPAIHHSRQSDKSTASEPPDSGTGSSEPAAVQARLSAARYQDGKTGAADSSKTYHYNSENRNGKRSATASQTVRRPATSDKRTGPGPDSPAPALAGDRSGFYVVASDHDLLYQVSKLLHRQGYFGLMDTAGRVNYVIDGRRGPPLAARRILETTQRILRDRVLDGDDLQPLRQLAIDQVLSQYQIPAQLKGCRYLRYILQLAAGNDSQLRPVSKTLYPAAAEYFKVSIQQIERDIRYALSQRTDQSQYLTNTAAICRFSDDVLALIDAWNNKAKPSAIAECDTEGYLQNQNRWTGPGQGTG